MLSPTGRRLRTASDPEGQNPWLTAEEAERAQKDAERRTAEGERRQKERALARVAEIEEQLRERG